MLPIHVGIHLALRHRVLMDLHQTRDDMIVEVIKAPKRKIGNVISNLHASVHLLLIPFA